MDHHGELDTISALELGPTKSTVASAMAPPKLAPEAASGRL